MYTAENEYLFSMMERKSIHRSLEHTFAGSI